MFETRLNGTGGVQDRNEILGETPRNMRCFASPGPQAAVAKQEFSALVHLPPRADYEVTGLGVVVIARGLVMVVEHVHQRHHNPGGFLVVRPVETSRPHDCLSPRPRVGRQVAQGERISVELGGGGSVQAREPSPLAFFSLSEYACHVRAVEETTLRGRPKVGHVRKVGREACLEELLSATFFRPREQPAREKVRLDRTRESRCEPTQRCRATGLVGR